jgi:hypothetical protein
MSRADWLEMRLALVGALRLARGDRSGLSCFVASIEGFWRSFRAAVLCYPLYLLLLTFRVTADQLEASDEWSIAIVETIGYVIGWIAFPLLILPVTRWLGRDDRFFAFMVAYNWSQLPQTLLFVVIALVGTQIPSDAAQALEFVGAMAILLYEWFIARVALQVPGAAAALVVLVDVLLGTVLSKVTELLY